MSSRTIGAPCALRKLQKVGKERRGNGQEPLAAVGDAGGSAMAKGNDGGGTWNLRPATGPSAVSPETAPNALERMTSRRTRASGPRSSQVAADMVLAISRGLRGRWGNLPIRRQSFRARGGPRGPPRRRDFAQGLCVDPCGRRGRANSSSVCFFSRRSRVSKVKVWARLDLPRFLDPCCGLDPCRGDV